MDEEDSEKELKTFDRRIQEEKKIGAWNRRGHGAVFAEKVEPGAIVEELELLADMEMKELAC